MPLLYNNRVLDYHNRAAQHAERTPSGELSDKVLATGSNSSTSSAPGIEKNIKMDASDGACEEEEEAVSVKNSSHQTTKAVDTKPIPRKAFRAIKKRLQKRERRRLAAIEGSKQRTIQPWEVQLPK